MERHFRIADLRIKWFLPKPSCTQLLEGVLQRHNAAYNPWRVSVPRSTFYTQMINSPAVDLVAAYKLYAYFLFSGMTRRRPTRRLFKFWDGFVWEEKAECLLWGDLSKRHKLQHDLAQIDAGGRGRGLPPIPTL